jgi:hypothetical protein
MKKVLVGVLGLLFLAGMAGTAMADSFGSATAAVHAKVVPNISVTPSIPIVDAGTIQSGDLKGQVVFLVHANTESVKMWVTATDLFKGDDPVQPTVPPIPLKTSAGATIAPSGGGVLGGGSNVATLPPVPNTVIGDFPAYESSMIVFEGKDNGTFSKDVMVTVWWNLSNNEQPQGDYGARVMLSAMVMP